MVYLRSKEARVPRHVTTQAERCARYTAPPQPRIPPTPGAPLTIPASEGIVHQTDLDGEFLAICQPGGAVFINNQAATIAYAIRIYPDEIVTASRCDLERVVKLWNRR